MKYREAKQKIQILGLVGGFNQKHQMHEGCLSPRMKTTRLKTSSVDQFHHLKFANGHSQIEENISTKPYLPESQEYYPKRNMTPTTTMRDQNPREDSKMLQSLMRVHEQLEKLSLQIENKDNISPKILQLENNLYGKMQEVVEKIQKMETRETERENKRVSREKEKSAKRYSSSMKVIEKIGTELLDFKVDS